MRDEMAAQTVELLQLVYRATCAAGGAKRLPEVHRIPRPKATTKRTGWADWIRGLGHGTGS